MITMYDSGHADSIPADAKFAAGYIDRTNSYGPIRKKLPHATVMTIATYAAHDADCLDVEDRMAKPEEVAGWWKRQRDRGVARPVIYANVSHMKHEVWPAIQAAGIARSSVRLWSADFAKSAAEMQALGKAAALALDARWAHICGPATCKLIGIPMDGTQFSCYAHYTDLDQSLLVDNFFGEPVSVYTCEGQKSLHGLSQQLHNPASEILRLTAEHSPGAKFHDRMADYLNEVFAADTEKVPEGITVYHPEPFHSHGTKTLQGLALTFNSQPSAIIRLTAENSPGAVFSPDMAKYLNDVFSRSNTHVPSGIHLVYEK